MTHLGADVAAYVDGQLSDRAMHDAEIHVGSCGECERAVRQERLVKARMGTQYAPSPSNDLVASLSRLQAEPPPEPTRLQQVGSSTPIATGFALMSASLLVLAVAYLAGGEVNSDRVQPRIDALVSEFLGTTPATMAASFTAADPAELNANGWACAKTLGTLPLTFSGIDRVDQLVVANYGTGPERLWLYEQPGRLDEKSLSGFKKSVIGDKRVWLRAGDPMVITWESEGIVLTVATNLDENAARRTLADLPTYRDDTALGRVRNGLNRMADWVAAA